MTPADNVYYFGPDIDVRLCLKNAYTTLRTAWVAYHPAIDTKTFLFNKEGQLFHDGYGGTQSRYEDIMRQQDLWDIPFRYGTERIAVKRDPVKRFISAVSYLDQIKIAENHMENKKSYIDLTEVTIDDIDHILDALEKHHLRDEHFFTQSWFLGDKNQYDRIYDITEVNKLLEYLDSKVTMRAPVKNLWKNKTKGTDKRIELTKDQEIRVVKLYAKDYANGWC